MSWALSKAFLWLSSLGPHSLSHVSYSASCNYFRHFHSIIWRSPVRRFQRSPLAAAAAEWRHFSGRYDVTKAARAAESVHSSLSGKAAVCLRPPEQAQHSWGVLSEPLRHAHAEIVLLMRLDWFHWIANSQIPNDVVNVMHCAIDTWRMWDVALFTCAPKWRLIFWRDMPNTKRLHFRRLVLDILRINCQRMLVDAHCKRYGSPSTMEQTSRALFGKYKE